MEMEMMEVDVAPALTGAKRPVRAEDPSSGLEEGRRREEERGKMPKWSCWEAMERSSCSPDIREILHRGYMLRLRNDACLKRSAKVREDLARRHLPPGSESSD
ncbi:hypothetical protein ACP70R_028710 [Stipagrostis hirtigluma subsp. patula]